MWKSLDILAVIILGAFVAILIVLCWTLRRSPASSGMQDEVQERVCVVGDWEATVSMSGWGRLEGQDIDIQFRLVGPEMRSGDVVSVDYEASAVGLFGKRTFKVGPASAPLKRDPDGSWSTALPILPALPIVPNSPRPALPSDHYKLTIQVTVGDIVFVFEPIDVGIMRGFW